MSAARVLFLACALSLVACRGRWVPNSPVTIYGRNEAESFERIVKVLKTKNYEIAERDAARGYVKAWAKTKRLPTDDGKTDLAHASWFVFKIDSEGDVRLTTHGYHVREQTTVRKTDIDQELSELEATLKRELDTASP